MNSRRFGLVFTVLMCAGACSSLPRYGQGTYGFFAPEGVSPEVVAGNVWWEIDPPNARGFRGLFWLERPLLDEPSDDLAEGDTLPFLDYDDVRKAAGDQFPRARTDSGIFALQPDQTVKSINISEADARSVLEEIRVHNHLRPESKAAGIFRSKIAPDLEALHTPITWHHGRNSGEPYWVPIKFKDRVLQNAKAEQGETPGRQAAVRIRDAWESWAACRGGRCC